MAFTVTFDRRCLEELDRHALEVRQDFNIGNPGRWFSDFRSGLYACQMRLNIVEHEYSELHAWKERVRTPWETEHRVPLILFAMDSALECLVFALNALGWAVLPSEFRDITDAAALKRISPRDVLGDGHAGYARVFPRFADEWRSHTELVARVVDLHDVSKHRSLLRAGGQLRNDPPRGFFERLGLAPDDERRMLIAPMAEVILPRHPKRTSEARDSDGGAWGPEDLLENLVPRFARAVEALASAASADALKNIPVEAAAG